MSLGMGAEWPGERDSGPELARGWAGSWIVRICTFLATKIFQEFSCWRTNLSLHLSSFLLSGMLRWPDGVHGNVNAFKAERKHKPF